MDEMPVLVSELPHQYISEQFLNSQGAVSVSRHDTKPLTLPVQDNSYGTNLARKSNMRCHETRKHPTFKDHTHNHSPDHSLTTDEMRITMDIALGINKWRLDGSHSCETIVRGR